MARSRIVKFRLSASEFEGLVGRLKGTDTVSSYCRRALLGINGKGQLPPATKTLYSNTKSIPKVCPVTRFCPMRKGRYCTRWSPVCPLGREKWELL